MEIKEEVEGWVIRSSRGLGRGKPGGSHVWDQSEMEGKEEERKRANAGQSSIPRPRVPHRLTAMPVKCCYACQPSGKARLSNPQP